MSKIDQAIEIVKADPTASRKDLVAKFVSELGMTPAGASTYVANARKKVNGVTIVSKKVASKKVDKRTNTAKAVKRDAVAKQIVDDNQAEFEKDVNAARKFKLERPIETPLAAHIVDVIAKMPASEKKTRIAKMVDLCELLEV